MTIAAILQNKGTEVIQVQGGDSMRTAVALLAERRIGCVPVVDGDQVIGIFSERDVVRQIAIHGEARSEEHTSELQSLMRISYAVFCLKTKKKQQLIPLIKYTPQINQLPNSTC